jgi:uncharacterized protein (DUF305 family)
MSCQVLSKNSIDDKEYLEMMIKHHKVAIRLNEMALYSSDNDYILDYARRSKARQEDKIVFMETSLKTLPNIQGNNSCGCERDIIDTPFEYAYPGLFNSLKCNDKDFMEPAKPKLDLNMNNQDGYCSNTFSLNPVDRISDNDYVKHMVSHHNSAVQLSKLLVRSTKEPRLFVLAQTIISDQNKEMFELNYLQNNIYNWKNMIPQSIVYSK